MKNILRLFTFVVLLAMCGVAAEAQQATKVPRIGFLLGVSPSTISDRTEAFRQGLRELGYVEGKTLSLSIDMQRENSNVSPRSRPS